MKKFLKVLMIIGIVLVGLVVIRLVVVNITTLSLRAYIKSFDKVEYTEQIVPTKEEEGYYTLRSDDDLKIMVLTDLHIAGGFYSLKKDKKTVYELMTMVQKEKPDLVILDGDQTYPVPGPLFHGGGTFNNKMVAKNITLMFKQLGVYYTVVFGNHDTESFDFYSRKQIGNIYNGADYCIFESNFDGYGVTNQCVLLKNNDGKIKKALMLIDSNAYVDNSFSASVNWLYDTIHDEQVEWAKQTILDLSEKEGQLVKSLFFFHIPVGEFETAYRELKANNWNDTTDTKYVGGVWDEEISEDMGGRIWYGGCQYTDKDPNENDKLFEELGPDGIGSMEACFVGHDHTNNAVVIYRGVMLSYGYSLDNTAYADIAKYGLQRGSTVITVKNDGSFTQVHKNAYLDYGVSIDKFFDVNINDLYMPDIVSPSK